MISPETIGGEAGGEQQQDGDGGMNQERVGGIKK
jgi:hypothetical protein